MTLSDLREVLSQDGALPALRGVVFLFGLMGSVMWSRRLPRLALALFATGSFVALSAWLIQIRAPIGLGTDADLTDQWAQAGVNAFSQPKDGGFVWGVPARPSLPAALSAIGTPFALVVAMPQIVTVSCFAMLLALPFASIGSKTTASLAAVMLVAGGAWPGASPYGSILLHPLPGLVFGLLSFVAMFFLNPHLGRRRHRLHLVVFLALVVAATFDRAWHGGAESTSAEGFLSACALVVLMPAARALLRLGASSPATARRVEAVALLAAFTGGGLLWWTPVQSLRGFAESRDAGSALRQPMDWIRSNVGASDVVLASPAYSAPIAALAGHRVLFRPTGARPSEAALSEPFRRDRLAASARQGRPIERLALNFSVTHFLLGPGEAAPNLGEGAAAEKEPVMDLVLVYQDAEDFRIFRLAKK